MNILSEKKNDFFAGKGHRARIAEIMEGLDKEADRSPQYYAVLYLLTASDNLYRKMKRCFFDSEVDFEEAVLKGLDGNEYAVYKAAKEIYLELGDVILSELCDPYIFGDKTLKLVINAGKLVREGYYEQIRLIGEDEYL